MERGIGNALTDESYGTRRLFALSAPWLKALQAGITLEFPNPSTLVFKLVLKLKEMASV